MPLSEAKSLLNQIKPPNSRPNETFNHPTTNSHVLLHEPEKDLAALEELADSLETFSPIIGLQQIDQPNCLFLDITGLDRLFGGEHSLACQVRQHCQTQGYIARVAVADTISLAWGAVRFLCQSTQSIVLPVHDSQVMPTLPIEALQLSSAVTRTLHQLGILTIRQLLQLPRNDLTARFGNEINQRLDQMTADLEEPIVARQKPPIFHAQQLLDFPTSNRQTVDTILQQLTSQLCSQLTARQQGALEWRIKLYCQNRRLPLQFCVRLFQPTATAEHIMQLACMQLEQIMQPQHQPHSTNSTNNRNKSKHRKQRHVVRLLDGQKMEINEITVEVTSSVLLTQQQRHLFDENPRQDLQELGQLINRLASRLGTDQVLRPTVLGQAQPEHAFRFLPVMHSDRRRQRSIKKQDRSLPAMSRPLQLFHPPLPLKPTSSSPAQPHRHTTTPPAQLTVEAHREINAPTPGQYQIIHFWGPERIETGWWRAPITRRDYWRVETCSSQQLWIFRDLKKGNWFMHGAF